MKFYAALMIDCRATITHRDVQVTKKTLSDVQELIELDLVAESDRAALMQVTTKYSLAISKHLQTILHHEGVAKQFVPTTAELVNTKQDLIDPIGDKPFSPVKGLVHRYPDRCLLKPVTVCPVYCRFCFRRETVGQGNPALTAQELLACYKYIQQHTDIWEVILSGGDPLILKAKQIHAIISALDKIQHVEVIRIHTRIPIVDPARVDSALIAALTQRKPIYVVLHINHPDEFTEAAILAIDSLADNGIVLLGQSVLLKGINDNVEILGKLMRTMVKHRIKPYYLHHMDFASGTSHFRTKIAEGQKLVAGLRGNYSGLCQPEYVLDIPGGAGKSPIGPTYLSKHNDGYKINSYAGEEYLYSD